MRFTLLCTLLFAAAAAAEEGTFYQNPRYLSPNGETCLVVRLYPKLGDFDRVTDEEFWREDPIETWLNEYPREPVQAPPPEPALVGGGLYRIWPSGYRELLSEFKFQRNEQYDSVLVADDGHVVTHGRMGCGAKAELLTIRAADGSIVRTLLVRDVLTWQDQQWLCRGKKDDVRYSMGEKLRLTMLVTDGEWDAPQARQESIDIDLERGDVAAPQRDRCPPALLVVPEAEDATSQVLLARAVVRVLPEYPEIAAKARITGRVSVQVAVDRDGRVEAARIVKPLPFGLDQAVQNAMVKWEFAPDSMPATGVLVFRFEILRTTPVEVTTVCHLPLNAR